MLYCDCVNEIRHTSVLRIFLVGVTTSVAPSSPLMVAVMKLLWWSPRQNRSHWAFVVQAVVPGWPAEQNPVPRLQVPVPYSLTELSAVRGSVTSNVHW